MTIASAIAVAGIAGYLFGSVPTGLLVGRLAGVSDLRSYGSGKTGFTNSLRTIGIRWALLVLLVDAAKGAAPVVIGQLLFDEPWAAAAGGIAAVVGHTWPVFAGFRGGRGVATAFGAFLVVSPAAALAVVAVALVSLALFRYVSLMSMVGVVIGCATIVWLVLSDEMAAPYLWFGLVVTAAIVFNHQGNIRRLLAGTEPKIGQGGERRLNGS